MKRNEFLYLSDKLDCLDERLDSVERVLELQEQNLQLHMKRSEMLEDQIKPLNKFMYACYGALAVITFLAGLYEYLKK